MTIRLLLAVLFLMVAADAQAGRCALIESGSIAKFVTFPGDCPPDPSGKPSYRWLPAPEVTPPTFDTETQVREGPTHVIGATQVTQSYTVRSKTAQELDDDKTGTVNRINKAVIRVLCRLENHDRASDGKAALTEAQCFNAFKGFL